MILEQIAALEEHNVQQEAVNSLVNIAEKIPPALGSAFLVPLIQRLVDSQFQSSKRASATLFPYIYSFVPERDKVTFRTYLARSSAILTGVDYSFLCFRTRFL
jgi:hypothetical protein